MIFKANEFAEMAHTGQTRKGTGEPYITHPRAVAEAIIEDGYHISYAVAGLLHDVIEDTGHTYEELVEMFGKDVADIVVGVSEDKSLGSWKQRKTGYIENIELAPFGSMIVAAGDKWHNLSCTYSSWLEIGDECFKVFNANKKSQSWWYRSMLEVFKRNEVYFKVDEIEMMLDEMGM